MIPCGISVEDTFLSLFLSIVDTFCVYCECIIVSSSSNAVTAIAAICSFLISNICSSRVIKLDSSRVIDLSMLEVVVLEVVDDALVDSFVSSLVLFLCPYTFCIIFLRNKIETERETSCNDAHPWDNARCVFRLHLPLNMSFIMLYCLLGGNVSHPRRINNSCCPYKSGIPELSIVSFVVHRSIPCFCLSVGL